MCGVVKNNSINDDYAFLNDSCILCANVIHNWGGCI